MRSHASALERSRFARKRAVGRSPAASARPGPEPAPRTATGGHHGHHFSRVRVRAPAGAGAPIQRNPIEWLKRKLGRKKEDPYASLSPQDQRVARFGDRVLAHEASERFEESRRREREDVGYRREDVDTAIEEPARKLVQTNLGLVSGLASGTGSVTRTIGQTTNALEAGRWLGAATAPVGAALSLVESGAQTKRFFTSQEKKKDKALVALDVASNLGKTATTAFSGAQQAAAITAPFFKPVASAAQSAKHFLHPIAAPAALVTGASDIVSGTVGGGLAAYRRQKLANLEKLSDPLQGTARFAKQQQTTKGWSNLAKAIGGGLAVGGGAALLAAGLSNPVGWGLLGGAAAIGLGITAFKKLRKHYLGKKILKDREYQRQLRSSGVVIPDDRDLKLHGGWAKFKNLLTTRSSRAHDLVRGQLATKLADDSDEVEQRSDLHQQFGGSFAEDLMNRGVRKRHIRSLIGIREMSESMPFEEEAKAKWLKKRSKNIAQALDA